MALLTKKPKQRRSKVAQTRRSPIASYYRGENPDSQSPFSKRTPRRRLRRYVLLVLDIVLIIGLTAGLGYSLMVQPRPKVIVTSQSFHNLTVYQSAAARQLGHLNNRNKITFNEAGLTAALKKQFPEINNVLVELPLFSETPTIRLDISAASFYLNTPGGRFIVDSKGTAVDKSVKAPAIKNLPIISDQSGFRTSPGQQVLSAESVAFINTLIDECHHGGVIIASLSLPAVPQELDLRTADQPYYTKFYLGGDVLTQTGQFLATRRHFDNTNQTPGHYLDVRVPGKIFYK